MALRVAIIAGEPSGDKLASELITRLRQLYPDLDCEGVCGPEMIKAGCVPLYSMDELAVMGLLEPLMRLPRLLKIRYQLLKYLRACPPDLFIGIDAPDFNLGIAKKLKSVGVPTVHYVSPSVWAWRSGRVALIKQAVDLMLTLFPFEVDFYQQHKIPAYYTGHPLADEIPLTAITKQQARQTLELPVEVGPVIGLLPGSRNSEILNMLDCYLQTAVYCQQHFPNAYFLIPVMYAGHKEYIEQIIANKYPNLLISCHIDNKRQVMASLDCALVTSGTATLELLCYKVPMVVAYKTNWLTYQVVKRLIKIKQIALPNIISGKVLVPEYIQQLANPNSLAYAILQLLNSAENSNKQTNDFYVLHQQLKCNASDKAAEAIVDFLGKQGCI